MLKFKNLIFFNIYGNGDIFNSKQFVSDTMRVVNVDKVIYQHPHGKLLLQDVPNLYYEKVSKTCPFGKHFDIINNNLYINTWIGLESKYVLPGIGCALFKFKDMFNDIFENIGYGRWFDKDIYHYTPTINYLLLDNKLLDNIDKFVDNEPRKKILVSNGFASSDQAVNFNFDKPIYSIAKKYPDIVFILTQKFSTLLLDNVVYTEDIIKAPNNKDLNEISYLSTYCNGVIGRSSGPYVFTQVKDNYNREDFFFLSFCRTLEGSNLLYNIKTNARKTWSNVTDVNRIVNRMEEEIEIWRKH